MGDAPPQPLVGPRRGESPVSLQLLISPLKAGQIHEPTPATSATELPTGDPGMSVTPSREPLPSTRAVIGCTDFAKVHIPSRDWEGIPRRSHRESIDYPYRGRQDSRNRCQSSESRGLSVNIAAAVIPPQPGTIIKPSAKTKVEQQSEEVRDQFLQSYDKYFAEFQESGAFYASRDREPDQQQRLRAAVENVLSSMPGVSSAIIAQTAIRCLEVFAEDPAPVEGEEEFPLVHGNAPEQAVRLAALATIEDLPLQKGEHPHSRTLAHFSRELSRELQPHAWNNNLDGVYGCDYSASVAGRAIEELATQGAGGFSPSLSATLGKVVLTSNIFDDKKQVHALDKAFQTIEEDQNPLVRKSHSDGLKAQSGEAIEIKRSHPWIPLVRQVDHSATALAKTAVMQDLLDDHDVDIARPFREP